MDRRRRNHQSSEADAVAIADDPSGSGAGVESAERDSTSTNERVARRAYQRFEDRGGEHGRDMEDWLEAEREVTNETSRENDN